MLLKIILAYFLILYILKNGEKELVAEVIIQSNVKKLDRVFDYNIPIELEEQVKIGSRVLVPFGNIKKLEDGFVINIKEKSEFKIKDIASVQKGNIEEEKINLAKWIAERCFCNISDCLKLMLPPGTSTKNISNRIKERTQLYAVLEKDSKQIESDIQNNKIKSEKQKRVLKLLLEQKGLFLSEIEMIADVSKATIDSLSKKGYIQVKEEQIERNPLLNKNKQATKRLKLNTEQQNAYDIIKNGVEDEIYNEFLIHGVTGSRKN